MKKCINPYLGALFLILLLSGCGDSDTVNIPAHEVTVIDGDTISVQVDNKKESIRFLLVDSPELNHSKTGKQPYSEDAKQFVTKMIENSKTVTLEKDTTDRDKHNRLLAYVYADGKSIQEALLKEGLARVAYVIEPNTKFEEEYRTLEVEAKKKKVGIWSVDGYVQKDGFHPEVINPVKTDQNLFVASKNSDVYHPISCTDVVETIKPENRLFFISEEEAQKNGLKRSKVDKCWKD